MKLADLAPCFDYPYMTVRQLMVLLLISREGKIRVKDVALALHIPTPCVTRAFDGLSVMKFIYRERGERDRRDIFGVITGHGRDFVYRLSA